MPIWNGTLRTERGTADWLLVSVRALVLGNEIRAAVGMNGTFRTERGTADWLLVAVRALVLGNEIRAAAIHMNSATLRRGQLQFHGKEYLPWTACSA